MSEEATVEPGVLEKRIIRQVEFYFGDRNLRRDKFLLEQVKKDDGWVPFSVLLTFNRLKQLTTETEVVAAALRMSTMLEVSEDGSKVRRPASTPLPDPMQKRSAEQQRQEQQRTVYAKGFPLDATLDQLQEYFDQFGPYDIITMRKKKEVNADGTVITSFKGSVFVEFKEQSSATKFIDAEELKYGDAVLIKEYKSDYIKRKKQEETDRKKALLEEEEKKKMEAKPKVEYTHGHILKFVGCGEGSDREKIKAFFTKYATVLWIEFSRGDTNGYVRFQEEDGAKRAVDGATADAEDGKVLINGGESQLSIAEGEDEKNFYKRMEETQSAKLKHMKGGSKGTSKKRQRENARNKVNKRQNPDEDSNAATKEAEDEGDDDKATTDAQKDAPPSPKRAKQEADDNCNEQETKHDDNVDEIPCVNEET